MKALKEIWFYIVLAVICLLMLAFIFCVINGFTGIITNLIN